MRVDRVVAGLAGQVLAVLGAGQGLVAILRAPDGDRLVVGIRILPGTGEEQVADFDTLLQVLIHLGVEFAAIPAIDVGKDIGNMPLNLGLEDDHLVGTQFFQGLQARIGQFLFGQILAAVEVNHAALHQIAAILRQVEQTRPDHDLVDALDGRRGDGIRLDGRQGALERLLDRLGIGVGDGGKQGQTA